MNSTTESENQNEFDKCSVISDWSQTDDGKCGKELEKCILWKSELNINSSVSTAPKDQNQLDKCRAISDWSQIEDDCSESDVGQFMLTLFRKQLYTDVTFYPKIGEETLTAHRVVLAAKCQFFAELLFGNKTKEAEDMKMKVEISNLPFNIFKMIVEYVYTDEINFEDVTSMLDIFFGAKHFEVHSLVERCESYIESLELTEDNVCSILQMCVDRDIEELRNRCLSYIQENTEKVISSETFQKCTYYSIYVICNLLALSLNSEEQLIDAAVGWIHAHTSQTKPGLIMALLSSIRLLTLSASELGSIIRKHPDIMTAEDALKIMIFLNCPLEDRSLQNLPDWCNRDTQRRCFKQDNFESALKGTDRKTHRSGKILIPLKPAAESQEITEQSSLLQIECIKGRHQINAIKFSFPSQLLNQSIHFTISVKVVQQGTTFLNFERRSSTRSKEKLFEFFRVIKVCEGQVTNIEVTAESAKAFSLFQLDENQDSLKNEYFKCCVASEPADKRQFIVSEVQYSPQEEAMSKEDIPLHTKGVNYCRLPRRNTEDIKHRVKRQENKRSQKILSCPDIKKSGEENKEKEAKRKETLEKVAQARISADENTEDRMMSFAIQVKSGIEDVKNKKVDNAVEENEIPECDREKIQSNQENVSQTTVPCSGDKRIGESDPKRQEEDEKRKEKSESNKEGKVNAEENCGSKTLPSSEKRDGNPTLKNQEITEEGKMSEIDRKKLMSNGQMILPLPGMEATEIQDMHEQGLTDREIKDMSETDRKKTTNDEMHADQPILSFSKERRAVMKEITKKLEEPDGDRKKTTDDDRNDEQIILPRYNIKRTRNENLKQKETDKESQITLLQNAVKMEGKEANSERKEISARYQERTMADDKIGLQITLPQNTMKTDGKDANSERKEIPETYQGMTVAGTGIGRQITLPKNTLKTEKKQKNLKKQEENFKELLDVLRKNRERALRGKGNCDPEVLPQSSENKFEKENAKKEEGNNIERKIIPEKDRERMMRLQRYYNQMTLMRLDRKRQNRESKIVDEERKETPERHAELRNNNISNDDHATLFRRVIIKTSEVETKQDEGKVKRNELLEKEDNERGANEEVNSSEESFSPLVRLLRMLVALIISLFVKQD